jgi:competence protein ComEC
VDDLRDSNLSHLLAISGMNMAFITGFVFALVRYGLALVPPLALRINTKKVAAVVSLAVAAFYLLLSGANVATERAFVMVAVMLVAVLADRRALSLRSVAIAACILLAMRPESLLAPGFQMSFAATIALIAGFGALDRGITHERVPRWAMPVFTLVLSSVLAGLATAPLAAAHFNRFTDYGLVANLMTVPAMGLLIMPGAVLAVLLWPIGLEGIGLLAMEIGSRWILFIAGWIAGWDGAVTGIPMPGAWVLPLLALGALWCLLLTGRVRWSGTLPVAVALVLWTTQPRPPVLVSGDGALVGLLGPEGRALSAPKGAGFAAGTWLENDGDLAEQVAAAERPGFEGPRGARAFVVGDWSGVLLKGKGAAEALAETCASVDVVILATPRLDASRPAPGRCTVIDATMLESLGPVALWPRAEGTLLIQPTETARRLWSPARVAPPDGPLLLAQNRGGQ